MLMHLLEAIAESKLTAMPMLCKMSKAYEGIYFREALYVHIISIYDGIFLCIREWLSCK